MPTSNPADKDMFPAVSQPPADDESALASVLDESSERPAEVNDIWWRRLNEVRHHVTMSSDNPKP